MLSPALGEVLAAERSRLGRLADPVEVVRDVGQLFAALDDPGVLGLSGLRLDAIAQLRARGWAYARIAAACDLSRERVAQLSRRAKSRP